MPPPHMVWTGVFPSKPGPALVFGQPCVSRSNNASDDRSDPVVLVNWLNKCRFTLILDEFRHD